MPAAKSILVIEDDAKIARVVRVYLEGAGYRVQAAHEGRKGIEIARQSLPLAVILDLMLPDIPGEEVCQTLREIGDFPIIMLTSKASEEERVAGFALGADDYVVKPFSPRELVYRVKAVLKRSPVSEEGPLSFLSGRLTIDEQSFVAEKDGVSLDLTPTEFRLLHVLASSPARVFTREELIEKAMGYRFEGYERTVDAHIRNIRQKIEDDPKKPSLILTIYGVGYRFSTKQDA